MGDLLDITVPNLDNPEGHEAVTKRPRREQLQVEGSGRSSKRKLVWKVKTVQSHDNPLNATNDAPASSDDVALESESTRTPVTEDDLPLNDDAVILNVREDSPAESFLWRFF